MKRLIFIYVLLLFASAACKKEEDQTLRPYPIFFTQQPEQIDSTGVSFKAELLYSSEIEPSDYGFIWGNQDITYQASIKDKTSLGDFFMRLNSDLKAGEKYYCKAYMVRGMEIISNEIEFISKGSSKPLIDDFSPKKGYPGEQITLTGKHFSFNKSRNKIKVGKFNANVISSTSDSIEFILPNNISQGNYKIEYCLGDIHLQYDSTFKVMGLQIDYLSSMEAFPYDTVKINGSDFLGTDENVDVFFGDYKAEIISKENTAQEVIVPSPESNWLLFDDLMVDAIVKNDHQSDTFNTKFQIRKTWEKKQPPPYHEDSFFYQGVTYGGKGYILDKHSERLFEYEPELDDWSALTTFPGVSYGLRLFVVWNNTLICFSTLENVENSYQLWQYDFNSNSWSQRNNISYSTYGATYLINESHILIINPEGEVWKYYPDDDTSQQMNDFPTSFDYGFAFAQNNQMFLITNGKNWKYDKYADSWTEISSNIFMEGNYGNTFGFMHKASAHVYFDEEIYKFHVGSYSWIKVCDYPTTTIRYKTAFTIGNDAYIISKELQGYIEKSVLLKYLH